MVKANAYGHGVARVWSALSGADGFALLNLEEAILLREQGWKGPILLLEGFFHADELAVLDQYRLTTSVHSNWQIKALQQAKLRAAGYLSQGEQRYEPAGLYAGAGAYRLAAAAGDKQRRRNDADVALRGGGEPAGDCRADAPYRTGGGGAGLPALAGQLGSATLWHPEAHFDWVRPGIVLYGASPSGQWQDIANTGLKPVATLRSEIIGVQNLRPGEAIDWLWRPVPHQPGAADRHRRLRLCRWLSAGGAERHAGAGGWRTHHYRWTRIDGYAGGRFNALSAGRDRRAGRAVGQKRLKSTTWRPAAAPSAMS